MSQYSGAPRRNPAATFDDGAAQQQYLLPPPRRGGRQYYEDQSYLDGYSRRGRGRGRGSSSYSRPYTIIDEETGERYYVNAEAPPNPSSPYYSFRSPPPRQISDGRQYYYNRGGYGYSDHHPIQTIPSYSYAYDHYSPPTFGDVVLEAGARLIPSLVDLAIAKLEQMSTRIKREKQRPQPAKVRVNKQQNELQGSVSTRPGQSMGKKATKVAAQENGKSTATSSATMEMSTDKEYVDNYIYMETKNESLTSLAKSKAKIVEVAALKADIKILEENPAYMSKSARAAHEKMVVQIKERWGL